MTAKSGAERQAAYRQRVKESGGQARINMVVDAESDSLLEKLAEQHGVSKTKALQVAMAVIAKDIEEAKTRTAATGKQYRTAFERKLEELANKP